MEAQRKTDGKTWEDIMGAVTHTSPLMAKVSSFAARRLTRAAWIVGHIDRDRVRERFGQEGLSLFVQAGRAVRSVVEGETTPDQVDSLAAALAMDRLEEMNTRSKLEATGDDPAADLEALLSGEVL
jgi:hypothetical protein